MASDHEVGRGIHTGKTKGLTANTLGETCEAMKVHNITSPSAWLTKEVRPSIGETGPKIHPVQ